MLLRNKECEGSNDIFIDDMKKIFFIIVQLVAICPVLAQSNTRLIVTTDIGGSDPDDIQ